MTILTISDVHLGYSQSNGDELDTFLQALISRADIDALVILGDFIDMWRRDVSGIFLENHQILQTLLTLKQKKTVYYVVGNHDYHLLELANHKYPLEFRSELTLPGNGVTYVFKHGYEFDFEQRAPFMELLCDNMSDGGGQVRSDVWKWLTTGDYVLGSIEDLIELHSTKEKYLQHLISPPKDRLSTTFGDVEKKAAQNVREGQLLVFGHTHRPFVSPTQNLVNTGSWVNDEETHNSYVELSGSNMRLMQYDQGDITDITNKMTRTV